MPLDQVCLLNCLCNNNNITLLILKLSGFRTFFNSCKCDNRVEGSRRRIRIREDTDDFIHMPHGTTLAGYNLQLQGCAVKGLPIEALKICSTMQANGVEPDLTTYNCLIASMAHYSLYHEAWGVYCDMLAMGILPDVDTLNHLLKVCG